MLNIRLHLIASAVCVAFALPVQAQSLVALYEMARGADAAYLSAKAQAEANLYRAEQARAGLLPSAAFGALASQSYLGVLPALGPSSERGTPL